jgi:hypothetical protein
LPRGLRRPGEARQRDHNDELGKRQQLTDHAMGPEHQSRSKRNEVSCDMRREQPLQPQETHRVKEPTVETQQRRDNELIHGATSPVPGSESGTTS